MKKSYVFCMLILVLFLYSGTLFAENLQSIIPLDESVYADMDSLFIAGGRALPSTSRPWSYGEAQNLFELIPEQRMHGAYKNLYEDLRERVYDTDLRFPVEDGYQLGLGLDLYGEAYYHTNATDFILEDDWVFGYEDRAPVIKAYIELGLHDWFYTYSEMEYAKALFAAEDTEIGDTLQNLTASYLYKDTFSTNYFDLQYINFETPYRAFISAGGDGWNLQFGRDMFSWGPGQTGNFAISDNLDYYDALRFVSYHDHFKYEILYSFFDYPEDAGSYMNESEFNGMDMYLAHRIEFTPLDWLSFALSENVMYEQSFIDIKYLNPAYIFHNLNNRSMFNALAYAELNAAVTPGFNLYAQFAIDQARAPLEASTQPGSFAYMLGGTQTGSAGNGILTMNLEFAYTDPYMYLRDKVEFKVYQRHFAIGQTIDYLSPHIDFLGYPYGCDAIVGQLSTEYRLPGIGSFSASLFGMLHGDKDINTVVEEFGDYEDVSFSPSGDTISQTVIASTAGELELPALEAIGLWYQVDWLNRRDYTKSTEVYTDWEQDLQCSVGASISL